ncbi:MAG: MFS transporter [Acidimicrobiia bacterium]
MQETNEVVGASPVEAPEPTLRSLIATVYLPTIIFSIGQGAVIPIVALAARDIGASIAVAGATAALRGIGTMVFDVPSGKLVARFGEQKAMVVATALLIVSLVGCVASPSVAAFAVFMFLMGCAWSVWLLARLTYVSDVMPNHLRGRALSTLGGVQRIGNFIGPFAGALAISRWGIDGAYYVHIALAVVGCLVLYLLPEPYTPTRPVGHAQMKVVRIVRDHRRTFLTAGVVAGVAGILRSAREVVIPLWGVHIGLDAAQVSLIFGIAAALDMTLFYPAGVVSDRWGRRAVAVPCLGILSLGLFLLPLTHGFTTLLLVSLLLAFGNGLGSGIVLTLGSDFAPKTGRPEFLGVWRLVADIGTAGGPLLLAGTEALVSLVAASVVVGSVGLFGVAVVLLWMPEPMRRRPEELAPATDEVLPAQATA